MRTPLFSVMVLIGSFLSSIASAQSVVLHADFGADVVDQPPSTRGRWF